MNVSKFLIYEHRVAIFWLMSCIFVPLLLLVYIISPINGTAVNSIFVVLTAGLFGLAATLYLTRYRDISADQNGNVILTLIFGGTRTFSSHDVISCTLLNFPIIRPANLYFLPGTNFFDTSNIKKSSKVYYFRIQTKDKVYTILSQDNLIKDLQANTFKLVSHLWP